MWKKITYILMSIIVIVLITLFTLSMQIKKRNQDVFNHYVEEANLGNYDNFLKYQAKAYLHIDDILLEDYSLSLYYTDTLIVFVRPLKEVKHATDRFDKNDQTSLTVAGVDFIYYSKQSEHYGDFPISYGLEKISFYYYEVDLQANTYLFTLKDYDGIDFYNESILIETEGDFEPGFTKEEIVKALKEDQSYLTSVYVVFGLLVALSLGIGFYLFRKWH